MYLEILYRRKLVDLYLSLVFFKTPQGLRDGLSCISTEKFLTFSDIHRMRQLFLDYFTRTEKNKYHISFKALI
jgi:hypothetical protein